MPDGEHPQSPATAPGGSKGDSNIAGETETGWLEFQWDESEIIAFPAHPILPLHNPLNPAFSSGSATLPSEYTSSEGWSAATRSKSDNGTPKKVIGYYAAWQWYDNTERASPVNMQFNKVDIVNFAFFQSDEEGNVWGTDPWADPITL